MGERLRLKEVVIVEGKYDAVALEGLVDGLILTTGGFSIFRDDEKKALIRRLGAQRGLLVLTDSDAAGFRIRHYIEKIAGGCSVKHAYIPALPGKEPRKAAPAAEGTLGVEGLPAGLLRTALAQAGVVPHQGGGPLITHTDLYEMGISGGPNSAQRRRALLERLGLPPRLSKRALCSVLGSLYTREELQLMLEDKNEAANKNSGAHEKPALFWDFHGTLTLPDVSWFEAAMEAAAEVAPAKPLDIEVLKKHFWGTCLPWYSVPSRDTRHLAGSQRWWGHCRGEFVGMFQKCGFDKGEAETLAAMMRDRVLQPHRYTLYPDAVETLEELARRGYKSYILSNNFPELEELVEAMGVRGLFCGVFTSGLIGYDKPRPEIFRHALGAAGGPPTAWMFGDNPEDDIKGAKAAGLTAVAVHQVEAPDADHHIDELAEVLELLP